MPNAIDQYNTLLNLIETTFGENTERTSRLSRMYTNMRDRILVAPASSREYFHNCYPGGYLDHVLRVYEAATLLVPVYKTMGGAIDFTQAELTFATLHHDLGKLGDEDGPFYVEQDSDWHRRRGELYKKNPKLQLMDTNDRTVYTLQQYGVTMTKKEMLAIKMADGLFSEANQYYYKNNERFPHKSSLMYLVHWADWIACIAEKDQARYSL
jgi:hypothetical protein